MGAGMASAKSSNEVSSNVAKVSTSSKSKADDIKNWVSKHKAGVTVGAVGTALVAAVVVFLVKGLESPVKKPPYAHYASKELLEKELLPEDKKLLNKLPDDNWKLGNKKYRQIEILLLTEVHNKWHAFAKAYERCMDELQKTHQEGHLTDEELQEFINMKIFPAFYQIFCAFRADWGYRRSDFNFGHGGGGWTDAAMWNYFDNGDGIYDGFKNITKITDINAWTTSNNSTQRDENNNFCFKFDVRPTIYDAILSAVENDRTFISEKESNTYITIHIGSKEYFEHIIKAFNYVTKELNEVLGTYKFFSKF